MLIKNREAHMTTVIGIKIDCEEKTCGDCIYRRYLKLLMVGPTEGINASCCLYIKNLEGKIDFSALQDSQRCTECIRTERELHALATLAELKKSKKGMKVTEVQEMKKGGEKTGCNITQEDLDYMSRNKPTYTAKDGTEYFLLGDNIRVITRKVVPWEEIPDEVREWAKEKGLPTTAEEAEKYSRKEDVS